MASQATQAAQSLSTRSTRLSLDIHLKAPVIIVPQNTNSTNAVVVDLGRLNVSNAFQVAATGQKSQDGFPPVLDLMIVELSMLKISRLDNSHRLSHGSRIIEQESRTHWPAPYSACAVNSANTTQALISLHQLYNSLLHLWRHNQTSTWLSSQPFISLYTRWQFVLLKQSSSLCAAHFNFSRYSWFPSLHS